ncbi:MAG: class I SAM-dependent methyltransferase [Kofleriaceae bacterium]
MTTSEDAYWNAFYRERHPDIEDPSSFATYVLPKIAAGANLFELGCGNGRDALFFASRDLRVTACDRSKIAIETLQTKPGLDRFTHRPRFLVSDFAELDRNYQGDPPDVVYSRFTLHAIPASVASTALGWVRRALRPGGTLLIEARSVEGSLYGKGEQVERDAFIHDGHYRRFLRMNELTTELTHLGFTIAEATQSAGVAVYHDDDPVVIRLAATSPDPE